MTIDHLYLDDLEHGSSTGPDDPLLAPDEVLASMDRVAHQRAKAARGEMRTRLRRRMLVPALVLSGALALAAAADRFVQWSLPRTPSAAASSAAASAANVPALNASVAADARALAGVTKALAADQQAIAALAKAQAQMAAAATSGLGTPGGSATGKLGVPVLPSVPSVQVPNLAIPNVAVPAVPAPAVHSVTGASVALP